MNNTYIIVGSGRMGFAVAHHLCKTEPKSSVFVVDNNYDVLRVTHDKLWKLGHRNVNMHYISKIREIQVLSDASNCVVIATCGYKMYEELTAICVNAKMHMVDLGGNRDVVMNQREMNSFAKNVTIIPDCGLAPGMVNILAMQAYNDIVSRGTSAQIDVKMSVGGLPQSGAFDAQNPLQYSLVWSADGLINEYDELCDEIIDYKRVKVEPLSSVGEFLFELPGGLSDFEEFRTSGGSSNLPELLEGKVRSLCYKTVRYLGHRDIIKALQKIGMFSTEATKGFTESPRDALETMLENNLKNVSCQDMVVVRAEAIAPKKCETYNVYCEAEPGLTAMAKTTGYSAAVVAQMIACGSVKDRGVVCGEAVVLCKEFVDRLCLAGIDVKHNFVT